jgi:hypothetical protein
VAKGFK